MTLADNIKNARQTKKLSQSEFAEELEVHQTYVSMLERGLNVPTIELLDRMADVLDCTTDWLLGRDDRKNKQKGE